MIPVCQRGRSDLRLLELFRRPVRVSSHVIRDELFWCHLLTALNLSGYVYFGENERPFRTKSYTDF